MKLLTTKEAAERLDVTPATVARWCQRGVLDAQKVGEPPRGVWAIPESALEDFERPPMGRPPKDEDDEKDENDE